MEPQRLYRVLVHFDSADALARSVDLLERLQSVHGVTLTPVATSSRDIIVNTRRTIEMRWARAVSALTRSAQDARTIGEWAHAIGVGRGTLKGLCAALGVSAKRSLDFARLLRVIRDDRRERLSHIQDALDIVDPRTLQRLLRRAGMAGDDLRASTVATYVARQRLIVTPPLLLALDEVIGKERTD